MAKHESSRRNPRPRPGKDRGTVDCPDSATYINECAEQLLGQMMFAIGQGADGVHIHRSAVAKMRQRYEPTTYTFVKKPGWDKTWQDVAIYTLRYFEVIGRLAAHYATMECTTSIDAQHLEKARVVVEATYRAELAGTVFAEGDICP